jgi:MSHA biogenesis protein MshN
MSILNNTLKSLDDRNQESDFGLPPTVQLRKSFSIRKATALIAVFVLLVWSVFYYTGDKSESSQKSASTETYFKTPSISGTNDISESKSESVKTTSLVEESGVVPSEGMQGVPLSDSDRALLAQSTPVVEQVFAQLEQDTAEQESQVERGGQSGQDGQTRQAVFDDEAEYRKAKEVVAQTNGSVEDNTEAKGDKNTSDKNAANKKGMVASTSRSAITPKTQKQQSAAHLEAGLKAYQFGMFEDAEKNFLLSLQLEPKNQEARKQLAALYFGRNNIPMALSVLSEGVSIEPQNLEWRELMGKILIAKSRFEEALSVMPESLNQQAIKEQRSDYLIIMGTAAQAINRPDVALTAFSAMTVLQPQNGKWWLALGANYDELGQNDEVIKAFETALAQGGISPSSKQYVIERLNALKEVR